MFRIVERRGWFFAFSVLLMLPGIFYMAWSLSTRGQLLPLSIDYTGGTLWEMRFSEAQRPVDVRQVFVEAGFPDTTAFTVEDDRTIQVKFKNIETTDKEAIQAALVARFGEFEERSYRSIGPTIGNEVSQAAVIAVAVASILILAYIAFAFRQVTLTQCVLGSVPSLPWSTIPLVVISFACIMYLIAGWEIDALFLTAALTVIGYSVNDTIVVFDRIRENYRRYRSEGLTSLANRSIIETAQRSLGTQITTLLSLVAILALGGATLQQFVAVLIVGIISGTYSSIFNATALLVAWEERSFLARDTAAPTGGQAALS
ncbi:MAG: protein translocase subunit SecF [Caldilineaceae bacterium]